jgi:hypothetical protein
MRCVNEQVADLYDLDPLWKSLAVATERYGEATPYLLPAETIAESLTQRTMARDAEIGAFAAWRRAQISALEQHAPRQSNGLRAAWETWWSEHAPCTASSRSANITDKLETSP